MSDTIIDARSSESTNAKELIVRGVLIMLACAAVMLPVLEVSTMGRSTGSNIMHPRMLGLTALIVPFGFLAASGAFFTKANPSVQKIADGLALGVAILVMLYVGNALYNEYAKLSQATSQASGMLNGLGGSNMSNALSRMVPKISLGFGLYAFAALMVLAVWHFVNRLRRG
ncbi:hypothetical protein [Roseibium aggregatum]|jgi:hypothetical protein|uniref:Uncharacterized protein n=1 Tax=Roseibium aggregatum TaxID=187304 RepID=A0A0M6YCW8_9HYPH|nr:hypothetical protein [Roseibium aggregatum]CTQ47343.1 hypothetical protein LAL4801_05805 [Roseibium aggregatum]